MLNEQLNGWMGGGVGRWVDESMTGWSRIGINILTRLKVTKWAAQDHTTLTWGLKFKSRLSNLNLKCQY